MDTFGNDLSSGGQVLSREELVQRRERNGQCPTCGQKCFKKKFAFCLEPITVTGKVLNGRCLTCHPQDPATEELVASCAPVVATPAAASRFGSMISSGGGANRFRTAVTVASIAAHNHRHGKQQHGGEAAGNSNGPAAAAPTTAASPARTGTHHGFLRAKSAAGPSSATTGKSIRPRLAASASDIDHHNDGYDDDDRPHPSRLAPPRSSGSSRGGAFSRGGATTSEQEGQNTASPQGASLSGAEKRDSLNRRDNARMDSYLQRQTPRPSTVLLGGINVNDLFNDDELDALSDSDDDLPAPNGGKIDASGGSRASDSAAAASSSPPSSGGPVSSLSAKERHALHRLNVGEGTNSFLDIVEIMRSNPRSVAVQNEGLHSLSLVHDPDLGEVEECGRNGGFEVIINAMKVCSEDAMAQTNACKVLFILSASDEDFQMAIGHAGGISALVAAMKRFEEDPIVLEGCLLALSNICIPEENLHYALEGELVELVVEAMSKNVENCGLQEHGCAVLANIAVHEGAGEYVRNAGGCDTVVVSMVVNPMDVAVQCQALVALRNLCVWDDENKVVLASAGAIDVVIQAMQTHRDDAQVQARGSWVLGIIGSNEDNKLYIGENGGAEMIVRSMYVHTNDLVVQEKACRALWTLSVHPKNRYTIVEIGAIPAIIAAMQNLASEPNIQERGCGVMCNLAANDDDLKIKIVDEGALEVIVMAMVLHGENEMIQERAVALLHKLCIPENIERMINANVSPMMAVVAENFVECRERAEYVLTQLQVS